MPSNDGDAQAIEAAAAEWFGRQRFWKFSESDQAALTAWLDESLAHKVAYWRLVAAWQRTERLNAIPRPVVPRLSQSANRSSPRLFRVAVIAAALLTAVGGSAYLSNIDHAQVYSTGVGESRTLRLVDGSRIELNTDTVLKIDLSQAKRFVTLEKGEAFFQIHHNAALPFVVMVAGHRVTDLGTKFMIRRGGDRVEVVLVEGKARLDTAAFDGRAQTATLTPGEVATAFPGALSIRRPSSKLVSGILAWRSGVLVFNNETLGEAATEFNRYNKVKLIIRDPAVAHMPIAGRFPTDGVDRFADVVERVFGLHIRSENGAMVIAR
jgi:transmembrane sensor